MADTSLNAGTDAAKDEKHRTSLLDAGKKSAAASGSKVTSIGNKAPPSKVTDGPMGGPLMNWTQMLESLAAVAGSVEYACGDNNIENCPIADPSETPPAPTGMGLSSGTDDEALLNQLNQIFTPILVMQGIEGDITEKVQEACSQDNILLEKNVIHFDDETRMAQLVSVCALLISRQKNSNEYQMYKKASEIRNNMKLQMQKNEYAAARSLAQKFLVKVSTTNNSSVARNAANDLLPQTNHFEGAVTDLAGKAKDKEAGTKGSQPTEEKKDAAGKEKNKQ